MADRQFLLVVLFTCDRVREIIDIVYCVTLDDCQQAVIRASVDALCRDGTDQISRDPRTKRLKTQREQLTRL